MATQKLASPTPASRKTVAPLFAAIDPLSRKTSRVTLVRLLATLGFKKHPEEKDVFVAPRRRETIHIGCGKGVQSVDWTKDYPTDTSRAIIRITKAFPPELELAKAVFASALEELVTRYGKPTSKKSDWRRDWDRADRHLYCTRYAASGGLAGAVTYSVSVSWQFK